MRIFYRHILFLLGAISMAAVAGSTAVGQQTQPLRVGVVGLTHGHVAGFLPQVPKHPDILLVGIVEQDAGLVAKYKQQFHLDNVPFFSTINELMEKQHPAALLVYTPPSEHRRIVQDAAAYGVNVMVEKPLATNLQDALIMRKAARQHHIQLIVNYETTWYASNAEAVREASGGKLGDLWKVVVHDGHEGPEEIHVQPEFLNWLTDPAKNGAGAMFDFGCYGADLMTVLMHGESPLSVTAKTQQVKPDVYPHVEDDATVIVQYPHAQAILEGSWNWPFDVKDFQIYGRTGYAYTLKRDRLRVRYAGEEQDHDMTAPPLSAPDDDPIHYLVSVVTDHKNVDHSLGGIDTNVVVVQILDAARESAKTGRTIMLHPIPAE